MSRNTITTSPHTNHTPPLLAVTLWAYSRLLMLQPAAFRAEFGD